MAFSEYTNFAFAFELPVALLLIIRGATKLWMAKLNYSKETELESPYMKKKWKLDVPSTNRQNFVKMQLFAMVAVRSHESLNFDLLLDFITHHEKYWEAVFTQAPKSQNLFIKIFFFKSEIWTELRITGNNTYTQITNFILSKYSINNFTHKADRWIVQKRWYRI